MIPPPEVQRQEEARRSSGMRHLEDLADAAEDLVAALAAMPAAAHGLMPLALVYDAHTVAVVERSSII